MADFRVKKSLGQITGALEALIKTAEMYHDLCRRVRVSMSYVHMFNDGCHPEGSNVFRFGSN